MLGKGESTVILKSHKLEAIKHNSVSYNPKLKDGVGVTNEAGELASFQACYEGYF